MHELAELQQPAGLYFVFVVGRGSPMSKMADPLKKSRKQLVGVAAAHCTCSAL